MFEQLQLGFYQTFILDDNYNYFIQGIGITLLTTVLALLIGLVLGVILAIIRSAHDQQQENHKNPVLGFFNVLAKIYLTVIRGTPTMVQLLIMWFVIWAAARSTTQNMVTCAVLTFGINSGAYVAEIIRSGIMSIDAGQMEAGRSLGLSYATTMRSVIIPQAFKNVLPALGNEFIVLLKETSVAGYIALEDLTKGGHIIRSRTYDAFFPLMAVAAIYLIMVVVFSHFVTLLERRLKKSER